MLSEPYGNCAAQALRCREQNDRNGALVNARLNRLNGMVDRMNVGSPRTYESRGTARSNIATPPGRMVSISA